MISDNFVPNLISDAEVKLREAYRIAEANHRRSQQLQHQSNLLESQHRRDTNVMIYIRRRLAMCARKLGKLKEASVPNFFFSQDFSTDLQVPTYMMASVRLWNFFYGGSKLVR